MLRTSAVLCVTAVSAEPCRQGRRALRVPSSRYLRLPGCAHHRLRVLAGVISHRRLLSTAHGPRGPTAIYPGGLLPPLLTAIRAGLLRTVPGSASMVTLAGAIGKCHFALAGAGS